MLYSLLREWSNRRFQPAMTPSRLPNTHSTSQGKIRCSSYRQETHTHTNKKHTLTFVCLTNKHIQASISLWHCKSWLQWSQQRATKLHSSFVSLSKHPQLLANRTPAIHRDPHMPQETMVSTDLGHKCLKLANTEQPWAVTDDRNRFVAWKVRPKHKCLKLAFRVTRS